MSVSAHAVLVAVVERYETTGEPLTPDAVAVRTDGDDTTVAERLERLADGPLLAETAAGYRPTVTAREFLTLDVELDDIVALDVVEE